MKALMHFQHYNLQKKLLCMCVSVFMCCMCVVSVLVCKMFFYYFLYYQNEMLEEGQEYAIMLYTWRSCSRAIPQVTTRLLVT